MREKEAPSVPAQWCMDTYRPLELKSDVRLLPSSHSPCLVCGSQVHTAGRGIDAQREEQGPL